jgi:hypothetical protein
LPLDQLEITQRLEFDRHVLQDLGRLVDQQHLENDVELGNGGDAFTVDIVRVAYVRQLGTRRLARNRKQASVSAERLLRPHPAQSFPCRTQGTTLRTRHTGQLYDSRQLGHKVILHLGRTSRTSNIQINLNISSDRSTAHDPLSQN